MDSLLRQVQLVNTSAQQQVDDVQLHAPCAGPASSASIMTHSPAPAAWGDFLRMNAVFTGVPSDFSSGTLRTSVNGDWNRTPMTPGTRQLLNATLDSPGRNALSPSLLCYCFHRCYLSTNLTCSLRSVQPPPTADMRTMSYHARRTRGRLTPRAFGVR